jgi:hypothetical protein
MVVLVQSGRIPAEGVEVRLNILVQKFVVRSVTDP